MPYEYRRLTKAERDEILQRRQERGFPLHAPPHPCRSEGYYLVSAANFEHAPIMNSPARRTDFETRLLPALASVQIEMIGWVILPNHYHVLLGVNSLNDVSHALQKLHGATSHDWNREDGRTGTRQVWYRFSDRWIRTEEQYFCALNYIHLNPVKHGCVSEVYDWPWSSLHLYYEDLGRDWLRAQWQKYPLGDFGRGWDD